MSPLKIFGWLTLFFVLVVSFGSRSTWDIGRECTKCAASMDTTEWQIAGLTLWKTTAPLEPALDYQRIMDGPCQHLFHRTGSTHRGFGFGGTMIGCGSFREGEVMGFRQHALRETCLVEKRLHDAALARESMKFIDSQISADAFQDPNFQPATIPISKLMRFAKNLADVKSTDEWRRVLDSADQETDKFLHK